ncbi:sulfatase [Dysgonomonas sp. 511]|uniref:sulfatase family protein n=1 Tax=Dysgonomonas sp. 511 TaxID=2302930 RepID=UPI002103A8F7|nr:sulfatase [Dysgonomonas sp. 511]
MPAAAQTELPPQKTEKERPNILFILSDDHTSQSWGIYGGILSNYVKNENIRRLAAEGCVLDNAFCTNSISVPSRASIMTGAYSQVNGVYTLEDALLPEQDNIAKQLQAGGYQTALFGKWHLKKRPSGFDHFRVFHDQGEYYNPIMKAEHNWVDDDAGKSGDTICGFSTDIVTDMTIDWIKHREKDKPFMMFCHFKATHEPWDFPERFKHLYDDVVFPEPENLMEFTPQSSGRTYQGQQLENMAWRWQTASKDPAGWWCVYPELPFTTEGLDKIEARKKTYQKMIKDYLRCGAAIDDNIGRLLNMLDEEGLAENTIVIYVSDQGYFLGEHGFFDKRMMLEESLRMPFVIRYPKEIPEGTRNKDIILNVDFASLLADYANTGVPLGSQGKSFRDNLKGKTPAGWRQSMYYRYWTHHGIRPAHMGIRNHSYKLMFLYGNPLGLKGSEKTATIPAWEFYDLTADPQENHNQYGDPQYKEVIERMKKEMLELKSEVKDVDNNPDMQKIMDSFYW